MTSFIQCWNFTCCFSRGILSSGAQEKVFEEWNDYFLERKARETKSHSKGQIYSIENNSKSSILLASLTPSCYIGIPTPHRHGAITPPSAL